MDELKPCPLCGGEAKIYYPALCIGDDDADVDWLCVRCGDCGVARGHTRFKDHNRQSSDNKSAQDKAITAWNTRSPVTDEMVERAVLAILKAQRDLGADPLSWEDATDEQKSGCKTAMHAALTAALGGPHG